MICSGLAYDTPESAAAGGDGDQFEKIVGRAKENSAAGGGKNPNPDSTELKIILWANGFQVGDDGEFRDKEDPKNQEFIKELTEGYVPNELRKAHPKGLGVALEDKRQ